jgi:Flp pilus assembly pilin Flp
MLSFALGDEPVWFKRLRRWLGHEEGQDLIEYGLLCFLIAVAAVAGLTIFGNQVVGFYQYIVGHFP